jgi:uncharacterized protein with von Willebrand factor type A (vWA) domain
VARTCTVCTHEQRLEIERALVRREAYRAISRQFSIGRDALGRHVKEHLADRLKKASEEEDVRAALDVLEQLKTINGASLDILKEAGQLRRSETALKAIDRIHKQIELQAKLLGELDERPQVNLFLSPEWLDLRALIVAALEEHPGAKEAVLRALEASGNGSA